MVAIDHAIFVVPDLDDAAKRLDREFGLGVTAGGRHAGHGTGNAIVPLGSTYLELMAVVDAAEAQGSRLGRWAVGHTDPGLVPAALCLRVNDIHPVADALAEAAEPMSRVRPDGTVLSWHLAGLDGMLGPDRLPFFIQWQCAPEEHPAAAAADHRRHVAGIDGATIGRVPQAIRALVAAADGITVVDGIGVHQIVVDTAEGPISFR